MFLRGPTRDRGLTNDLALPTLVGMAIGYIVLTSAYYSNVFDGGSLQFMSTSLFGSDGNVYNQTAVIDPSTYKLNASALATVGLPRYTTTYAISQLSYNLSMGAAVTYILLWHWKELKQGRPVLFGLD